MDRGQREAARQQREEVRGEAVTTRDGRNVDPSLGMLAGEASMVRVKRPHHAYPLPDALPATDRSGTYYGLPAVKQPVWKASIPTYFWAGGLAGASATLAAAAQLVAPRQLRGLVVRGRWIAVLAIGASSVLLVVDLGRPMRFLHMLRIVRLSSPMNVGTWVLTASGLASVAAALGLEGAGLAAGALGLPLSGYTAVLVAYSAVPAWLHARRSLPLLFVASAMASAAAVMELLPAPPPEARTIWHFGVAGKLAEIAAMKLVSRDLDRHEEVGAVLRTGRTGRLWRAARVLSIAGLVATLLPRRRRLAGVLSTAGALALRFAVMEAGKQSARDPHATFVPQRRDAR